MLVLSRKNQESVVVGAADGLHRLFKVKVLEIRGTNVKLGFEVDPGVSVRRSESAGTTPCPRPAIRRWGNALGSC